MNLEQKMNAMVFLKKIAGKNIYLLKLLNTSSNILIIVIIVATL